MWEPYTYCKRKAHANVRPYYTSMCVISNDGCSRLFGCHDNAGVGASSAQVPVLIRSAGSGSVSMVAETNPRPQNIATPRGTKRAWEEMETFASMRLKRILSSKRSKESIEMTQIWKKNQWEWMFQLSFLVLIYAVYWYQYCHYCSIQY